MFTILNRDVRAGSSLHGFQQIQRPGDSPGPFVSTEKIAHYFSNTIFLTWLTLATSLPLLKPSSR